MTVVNHSFRKKLPQRPIMGGTNDGIRPQYYDYWRVGHGTLESFRLEFWVEQAGEFHCKPGYVTGNFGQDPRIHIFYHLKGEAVFEYPQRTLPVQRGNLLIVPAHQSFAFYYSSQTTMQYHWLAVTGKWPPVLGESPAVRLMSLGFDSEIEAKFVHIRETLILNKPGYPLRAIGIFYDLMARLAEYAPRLVASKSAYPETVRRAIIYLRENYAVPFNAAETATAVNLSQSHLRALFEKWVGESPKQFHTRCRIDQAKRLLSEQKLPISEVSLQVGFIDSRHFSRVFKQFTGVSPSQYNKEESRN